MNNTYLSRANMCAKLWFLSLSFSHISLYIIFLQSIIKYSIIFESYIVKRFQIWYLSNIHTIKTYLIIWYTIFEACQVFSTFVFDQRYRLITLWRFRSNIWNNGKLVYIFYWRMYNLIVLHNGTNVNWYNSLYMWFHIS